MVIELPTVDRRTVSFVAPDPPRTAPITWGQRALWMAIRRHGAGQVMFALKRWVAVPRRAQADPDRVYAAIAALMARHASLRTRLALTGDEPRQLVADAGELPVLLVPTAPGDVVGGGTGDGAGDPVAVAQRVADELASEPFAHADDWPQRIAVVTRDGVPQQVVVVFSHTTVDFRAAELVLRDLRLLLARGRLDSAPGLPAADSAPGLQSADIADLEQQDRLRRRSARAAAYWVDVTRRLSRDTRLPAREPLSPRFRRGVLVSAAADTAVRLLAVRLRTTTSTVLLAAVARVVGDWSGNDLVGMHTMVNNRVPDGYPTAIAKLNQLALVPVDLAEAPTVAQLVPRVWRAALDGYRHGYYDPQTLSDAFAAAGLPYATGVNPHCYLNDIRLSADNDLFGRVVTESAVRATMAATTYTPTGGFVRFTWRTRVEILDRPGALGLALTADTTYFTLDDIERFLRELEAHLVDAAFTGPSEGEPSADGPRLAE
ncbi:condensation domain-containing protein [Solwaraspora sp. WMMA2056]|uniref:condensation domain-containing protein n=1 Tax=Solwaraspora sp. WMMA2056 TaxID=3015161 RepID=UPI00259BB66D|nr:condensation domain-containing protein [Solwaraspora sp. WMMA2056]WJK41424.1 condensation domain-containing protein [Solwaraspora sp. WMMA2056]